MRIIGKVVAGAMLLFRFVGNMGSSRGPPRAPPSSP